jgi:acyl CoA:acetate/3-ketoacid CoA transferase beta subunit
VQVAVVALAVVFPTACPAQLEGGFEQWASLGDDLLAPGENSARSVEEPLPCSGGVAAVGHLIAYIPQTAISFKLGEGAENLPTHICSDA